MYAITFFSMLNEAYRRRMRHYIMLSNLINSPNMEKNSRSTFIGQLEWAAKDPDDILSSSADDDSIDDVRNLFRNL